MIMEQIIECPQCKGNKNIGLSCNTYKCRYCGCTFTISPKNETENYNNYNNQSYRRQSVESYCQPMKSKSTAGILAIIIGGFGAHHFYLGHIGLGILYLVFFWTWIPGIVGFIEGIIYLSMSDKEFNQKYNRKNERY